jgi:hypothetical protein
MLVYLEFISRRPGVGLHEFHAVVGGGQSGWAGDYGDDITVLNVGRSWRIGPEPEYLCAWYTPNAGIDRLDEWERVFRSGDADAYEEPFRLAARIDAAGCYEPLTEPLVGTKGKYYTEWFDHQPGASIDDVRTYYEERRARHPGLDLNLLIDRIGMLGPDPRGMATWGIPSWGDADTVARELTASGDAPIRPVSATFYADFGQEQL